MDNNFVLSGGETPKIRTHFTFQNNNINEWLRCFETHALAATIFMSEKNTPRAQRTSSTTIHIEFRHFFMQGHLLEPKTTQIQTYHPSCTLDQRTDFNFLWAPVQLLLCKTVLGGYHFFEISNG
jgi:hypothetical protein